MALISLSFKKIYTPTNNNIRTSSNTSHANQDNSLRIHRNAGYEGQRSGTVAGARETVGSSMEEAGIQLNAEQAEWKDDTDDESDDQELEAHYMYMAKIQEVSPDTVDSGPIFDTEPEQKVQNDDHYDVFAIECQHSEQSESVHNTYLIEQDAQNVSIESVDMNYDKLQRRNSIEYDSEMELECAKVKGDLLSYKMEYERSYNKYTQAINDLNQTIPEMKEKVSAHQDTISILKQQKDAQIKPYKTQEDKEIEKVIDLENKVKVLDNIIYKTGQSVQTMNMLNNKCRTSFAKPEFLKKAKQANPRLYDIGCYNDNLALMLSPESDELIRLEKESRSAKLKSLYDLFVPQREKSSEQRFFSERSRISYINAQKEKKKESFQKQTTFLEIRMDESNPMNKNCQSSLEIVNIQRDINTIVTGVELCKQKIAKPTYYGHIDPFIKNTIEQNLCPVITKINDLKAQLQDKGIVINEGSKILYLIEGTILEEILFVEFDEFMSMTAEENSESESDTEEPSFQKITFNTDYKIKTSLKEPLTDLELKPCNTPNLRYAVEYNSWGATS
nr:hypothetical protein [Tanacetum cinerariifolium]